MIKQITLFVFIVALICTPLTLLAQYTVVSATVTDPVNRPYVSCQVNISLSNPSGQTPIFGGIPPPQSTNYSATCDATGSFTVKLISNTTIINTPTQWNFNIVAQDGMTAFNVLQTIGGSTQNISAALSGASVIQPCAVIKSQLSSSGFVLFGNCASATPNVFPDGVNWTFANPILAAQAAAVLNMGAASTATGFQLPFSTFGVPPSSPAGMAIDSGTEQVNFNDTQGNNHYLANVDFLSASPITNGILVQVFSTSGPPNLSTVQIVGNLNDIVITNPDGTAGNPTIASFVTGVAAGSYTCPTLGINIYGKITSAANGTCSGGGTGNTTSTNLISGNLPVANGPASLIDSGISAAAGVLQFNGSTSGNITLTPSATASLLTLAGSNTPTLALPTGSSGSVSVGISATTGIDFVNNAFNYSQSGTNVFLLGVNQAKCNGTCNWSGSTFAQSQTFQSGVDTTTPGITGGTAFFRSASITGGGTTASVTGNAFFGTGNNSATGGASQAIGIAYFTAGGFLGASGALAAWTPGYTIVGQYYWADTTATAGTLGCVTTAGTNGQMPKIGTCTVTTNVPWKGVIQVPAGVSVGQAVFLVKSGHAAMLSAAAQADPAGSFVCIDSANAGDIIVQTTACNAGQTVGTIDQTGSGGTTHLVDVIARPEEAPATAAATLWNSIQNPSAGGGNLSLTMNAITSTFTFNAATGSADLWKLTDTTNNTGTGIMEHITTASGSTEIPWQVDSNGNGLKITTAGLLTKVGTGAIDATVLSGTASINTTGTAGGLSGSPNLPGGTTIATRPAFDNSTSLANTAYVDRQTTPLYNNPSTAITLSASTGVLTAITGTGCTSGVCTMTTPAADGEYKFVAQVVLTTAGVACTAGTIQVQLLWTDAYSGSTYSAQPIAFSTASNSALNVISIQPTTAAVGPNTNWISNVREFRAKASNTIKYQVNQTVAEASCTTTPVVSINAALYGPLGY